MSNYIKIAEASVNHKFVVFCLDGIEHAIAVGPVNINGRSGLSIGYRGEVVQIPFDARKEELKKLNQQ